VLTQLAHVALLNIVVAEPVEQIGISIRVAPVVIGHLVWFKLFFIRFTIVLFVVVVWQQINAEVTCLAGTFSTVLRRKGLRAPRGATLGYCIASLDGVAWLMLLACPTPRTLRVVAVAITPRQTAILASRRARTVCALLLLGTIQREVPIAPASASACV
jgi:hypothetical protein